VQPTTISPAPTTRPPNAPTTQQPAPTSILSSNYALTPSVPPSAATATDTPWSPIELDEAPVNHDGHHDYQNTAAAIEAGLPDAALPEPWLNVQEVDAAHSADRFTDEDAYQRNSAQALAQSPSAVYLNTKDVAQPSNQAGSLESQLHTSLTVQTHGKSAPISTSGETALLAPVTPALPNLPKLVVRQGKGKSNKAVAEPPPLATQFMRWLQEGVANSDIGINHSKAQVHFAHVEHASLANEGSSEKFMLLVSPLIFRNFASTIEGGDALAVQKEFFKAGWQSQESLVVYRGSQPREVCQSVACHQ
jgi:hypothetical protein